MVVIFEPDMPPALVTDKAVRELTPLRLTALLLVEFTYTPQPGLLTLEVPLSVNVPELDELEPCPPKATTQPEL